MGEKINKTNTRKHQRQIGKMSRRERGQDTNEDRAQQCEWPQRNCRIVSYASNIYPMENQKAESMMLEGSR